MFICVFRNSILTSKKHRDSDFITSRHHASSAIGQLRSRDHNSVMAASAAVRAGVSFTQRFVRVSPDCSICPLYRLKLCTGAVAGRGVDGFSAPSRRLQTSISASFTHIHTSAADGVFVVCVTVCLSVCVRCVSEWRQQLTWGGQTRACVSLQTLLCRDTLTVLLNWLM